MNVFITIDILETNRDERGFYATTAVSHTPGLDAEMIVTILRAVADGYEEEYNAE